jgi:hypothetical protein
MTTTPGGWAQYRLGAQRNSSAGLTAVIPN